MGRLRSFPDFVRYLHVATVIADGVVQIIAPGVHDGAPGWHHPVRLVFDQHEASLVVQSNLHGITQTFSSHHAFNPGSLSVNSRYLCLDAFTVEAAMLRMVSASRRFKRK